MRPSQLCPRCGMAACHRCNPEVPDQSQCGQCYHAFVSTDGVDPQECIRKEIGVHRYRARHARLRQVLSILLAGGGQMVRGAFLRGVLLMVGFLSPALVVLWSSGVLPELSAFDAGLRWTAGIVAGGVAMGVYVASLFDGLREEA